MSRILLIAIEALIIAGLSYLLLDSSAGMQAGTAEPAETIRNELRPDGPRQGGRQEMIRPDAEEARVVRRPVRHEDPLGVLIFGSVTADDGEAIREARITLHREKPERWLSASVEEGLGYALVGATEGKWTLACEAKGYHKLEREVKLRGDEDKLRMDLVLSKAVVIKVKIQTPDGVPFMVAVRKARLFANRALYAVATHQPLPEDLPLFDRRQTQSLGVGKWRAFEGSTRRELKPEDVGFTGELQLLDRPPVYVSAMLHTMVLASKLVGVGEDEVTFEIPLESLREVFCTIRLRVVDAATGGAIVGASAGVSEEGITHQARQATRQDGSATIENAIPGEPFLLIRSKEHETYCGRIRLTPGQVLDLGTVRLHKALTIKGTVLDSKGKPVPAMIRWANLDRMQFPQPFFHNVSTPANAEGEFSIWHLGRSRYLIHARGQNEEQASILVDTSAGQPETLRLALVPATEVKLQVSMGPLDCYTVVVLDESRLPVHAQRVVARWDLLTILLVPGKYTFEVHDARRLINSRSLTVGKKPLTINLPWEK